MRWSLAHSLLLLRLAFLACLTFTSESPHHSIYTTGPTHTYTQARRSKKLVVEALGTKGSRSIKWTGALAQLGTFSTIQHLHHAITQPTPACHLSSTLQSSPLTLKLLPHFPHKQEGPARPSPSPRPSGRSSLRRSRHRHPFSTGRLTVVNKTSSGTPTTPASCDV